MRTYLNQLFYILNFQQAEYQAECYCTNYSQANPKQS